MSKLTYDRVQQLEKMGRPPIELPAEIFFGGNEKLQKTPGRHHLPQYRETGTYNHPNLVAHRKRVAGDRVQRLANSKMSDVEFTAMGGIDGLRAALKEHGLGLNEKAMEVVTEQAQELQAKVEVKKMEWDQRVQSFEAQTGKKHNPVVAEPVNPHENIVAAAEAAANAKVTGSDDLSDGDDSEKDGNKTPVGAPTEDLLVQI